MLRLRAVQAKNGDCFILEFGTPSAPKFILIDGGPSGVYEEHLRSELVDIASKSGKLELVILSHVDNDHAIGLVDLFADLKQAQDNNQTPYLSIGGVWFNSFEQTIDPKGIRTPRLQNVLSTYKAAGIAVNSTAFSLEGIAEGQTLRTMCLTLKIGINPGYGDKIISLETAPGPIPLGNITLHVIGPNKKNLSNLRKKWSKWLQEQENRIGNANLMTANDLDKSVPNLSSIVILVEGDGKKILLTGDGLGTDILQGLQEAGLLDHNGELHVDILKLPHHGSARNITVEFFYKIIADQYLISANGTDDNPDTETLKCLVKATHDLGVPAKLLLTNGPKSVEDFQEAMNPVVYNYTVKVMEPVAHSMIIE